jgi:hypothetical protein
MIRCWISQGCLLKFLKYLWDIQNKKIWNRISHIYERYPLIRKPGTGYPKSNECHDTEKSKVYFFVLGYLSLSYPILVPIMFRGKQFVAQKILPGSAL